MLRVANKFFSPPYLENQIMAFKKKSIGTQKLSPEAAYIGLYFADFHTKTVSTPSSVSRQLLEFKIETEINKYEEFKDMSKKTISQLLGVVASANQAFEEADLTSMAQNAGIKGDHAALIEKIKSKLSEEMMAGAIARIFVKDALIGGDHTLDASRKPSMDDIYEAIRVSQLLYTNFIQSQSVETIAAFGTSRVQTNNACMFIRELHRVFHTFEGPTSRVRLSYVIDNIFELITGSKTMTVDTIIPGVAYDIKSVDVFKNLTFSDMIAAHLSCVRMIMAVSPAITDKEISLRTLVETVVTGMGTLIPYLPSGVIKPDADRISQFIADLWMINAIQKTIANDGGTTLGRYSSVMDIRKYKRDDTYDATIQELVTICSIAYESLLDVAAFIKDLLFKKVLYFSDIHPLTQTRVTDNYFKFLEQFKVFNLDSSHSRFLTEPAIIINHTKAMGGVVPNFVISDEDDQRSISWRCRSTGTVTNSLRSRIHYGEVIQAVSPEDAEIIGLVPEMVPNYYIEVMNPSFIQEYDLFRVSLTTLPAAEFRKKTRYSKFLKQFARMVQLNSVSDAMRFFRIPPDIAKKLMRKMNGDYFTFDTLARSYFFWNGNIAPVYEVAGGDESKYVAPFTSDFPFFVEEEVEGHSVRAVNYFNLDGNLDTLDIQAQKHASFKRTEEAIVKKGEDIEKAASENPPNKEV